VKKPDAMRSYLIFLIAFLLFNPLILNGQTDISISRKEFKNSKPGFKDAWKHVQAGDVFYGEKGTWFNDAFNEYILAMVYNSSNAGLNYKTGVSALYSDRKEEAAGFFLKALEINKDITEDILLYTGRSLQYQGKYSEAIAKITGYLNSNSKKSKKNVQLAREYIQECTSALGIVKDTLRVSIENAGQDINSSADEYSEVFTTDEKTMYFASRRQLPVSGKRYADGKFDENILISNMVAGLWSPSSTAGKELATKYCESPLYLNSAGDMLYIYSGSASNGDIKVSEKNKKGIWKAPKNVPFRINSKKSETSFTISPSGNEIYFVSENGKENIGGKDIYFIKKVNDRRWSRPQNAGNVINTIYDEESVRLSKTGDTLFFSSKGHNSMGGFDIFYCTRNKSGAWQNVTNFGFPVNTPWDDFYYYPSSRNDSSFYFASNRSGGYGGSDIYHGKFLPPKKVVISLPKPKPDTIVKRDTVVIVKHAAPIAAPKPIAPEPDVFLAGKVKDSETGEDLLAKIDIREINSGEISGTTASSEVDGSYRVKLPAKKSYIIDIHSTGYLSDSRRIDVPGNWSKDVYNLNIDLIKIKVGKKVVLKNILFETGKSVLTPESNTELNRLLGIMKENVQMRIEVSGHTDKTGSEPLNSKLSEARAKAVVDYLTKNDIDKSRMEFRGYGSLQPISDNSTAFGRAKNRRVEFKILEF
jgi:outer membrane protein OmpA-like peptidoglycan-associated protein/tetratricopeptide (TPR) repeat protein